MDLEPAALFSELSLERHRSVVAAVSGGSDSIALLFLLRAYLDTHAPHVRLTAVTIDHRLRVEAADEARAVARLCGQLAIVHRTLEWSGAKPTTGLIAAARDARHQLLAEAARQAGSSLVLTGHTMDDQAETVAMRRERRADGEGLAGIAPATLHAGTVWFCRPLLRIARAHLRDWLSRRNIGWIDDPSNDNPVFERVRVRAGLGLSSVARLAAEAEAAARRRGERSSQAASIIDECVSVVSSGLLRLDSDMIDQVRVASNRSVPPVADKMARLATPEVSMRHESAVLALRVLLACAGGTPHRPDRDSTEALMDCLAVAPRRATLSRAVVDARKTGIWIHREARNLRRIPLDAETVVWDGRWTLFVARNRRRLLVGPIGQVSRDEASGMAPDIPQGLERAAFSAEPGLFEGDRLVGHAAGAEARTLGVFATPLVAPHAAYLPSFDLDLAAALRRLLDLPPLPRAPWNHHIEA